MPTYLDPRSILHRSSTLTEEILPTGHQQRAYWHDYAARFLAANGLSWRDTLANPPPDGGLSSFISLLDPLLPTYRARHDLSRIDSVLMAHWTPDLHLGSSVINYVIHELGLPDCLALTISDRGPDAALFALASIANCQQENAGDALLLMADQGYLHYRSDLMSTLTPENNAGLLTLSRRPQALRYQGYHRQPLTTQRTVIAEVQHLIARFELRPQHTVIIADATLLALLPAAPLVIATHPQWLCAAPFAALAAHYQPGHDYLLLVEHQRRLSAVALRG
ncbi:hypothetical protein [Musicola paradisiaca]|uniref:Uncharacterized protein n=1 Tax=Musicola paradisiaca (strain Ech703) TaxID=579405 RepID=C6C6K2_MUSP7|nr:hypothetical protein [Musicola paradisiaca]ACS83921.1 hypothetical protein Dd703_0102 [Musicola paradisiaca Ech703]